MEKSVLWNWHFSLKDEDINPGGGIPSQGSSFYIYGRSPQTHPKVCFPHPHLPRGVPQTLALMGVPTTKTWSAGQQRRVNAPPELWEETRFHQWGLATRETLQPISLPDKWMVRRGKSAREFQNCWELRLDWKTPWRSQPVYCLSLLSQPASCKQGSCQTPFTAHRSTSERASQTCGIPFRNDTAIVYPFHVVHFFNL